MEVTFFIFDLSEFMKYSFYMQAKVETTEDTFPTFLKWRKYHFLIVLRIGDLDHFFCSQRN